MASNPDLERLANQQYQYGFTTDIEQDQIPPGLDESVVRLISQKKNEPEWLLEWRLKALRRFFEMVEERRCQPGQMQAPPLDAPHDGQPLLAPLLR